MKMKKRKKQFDYRDEVPYVLLSWMTLLWFILYLAGEYLFNNISETLGSVCFILIFVSAVVIAILAFKGTSIKFWFNPNTDSEGWVFRTHNKMKTMAKKLRNNYPEIVKKIRLKDTLYKVKITKKYRYHPNPMSIEEMD